MFEGDFPAVEFYELYPLNNLCANFDSAIFVDICILNNLTVDFPNQSLKGDDGEDYSDDQQARRAKTI